MQKKEGFLLFTEQKALFNKMTNEQAGILIKAIYEYEDTGQLPELDFGLEMAFTSIKTTLDKNRQKYEEISQKRSLAAKSKYQQKKQMKAIVTNVDFENNCTCIDSDNEKDNDNEKDIINNIKNDEDSCVDALTFYVQNIINNAEISDYETKLISNFKEKLSNELLVLAMKKAIERNVKNISYIKSIVNNWIKKNVNTIEDAEKIDLEFKNQHKNKQEFENQLNEISLEKLYEN